MKGSQLVILFAFALIVPILCMSESMDSEQDHSGDNCRGCHGNRFTQRAVITDVVTPSTIKMGVNATVEITVMDDCRNQGDPDAVLCWRTGAVDRLIFRS